MSKKTALPEDWNEKGRLEQVEYLSKLYLKQHKVNSPDRAISGDNLIKGIDKLFPDHEIPKTTFWVTLSKLVRRPQSPIHCPGRHQGYYLKAPTESEAEPAEIVEEEKARKQKEAPFYTIFLQWLLAEGYDRAKDTSSSRNQDLGTWGNPDLTGLRIHEMLGKTTDIEIATIEVKATMNQWKYWIFEAVAHRRFSNRGYFAFAHSEDEINKIDPDLKHYAEMFGVGVLVLPVSSGLMAKLSKKNQGLTAKELSSYRPEDIIEYASPLYTVTNYHFRTRYMKAIEITSEQELHNWGETA